MAVFNYVAKNRDGQDVRSSIEIGSRLEALDHLRKKGLTVTDLVAVEHPSESASSKLSSARKRKVEGAGLSSGGHMARRVKMTDLAIFCRQLAISVNAGVTLRDSLESLGAEQENLTLKHAVMGIVEQIGNGKSFSESAAKYSRIFDSMFCGLIKVAEESGKLPQTLKQLASYMERADKLQRRVRAMSTYPMFIGIFFVLVCIAMTRFILPKFTAVFSGLGGELPLISKTVFSANQYILDHFWVILGMTAGIFSALILYARTSDGIRRKDRLVIALPLFGKSIKKYILARFCRSLAIMVQSGVPISTALEICAQATGNHHMKKAVMDARNMIMTGGLIASSFEKSGIFPALIIRMLSVGEESGQLPEVLENVADLYDDQVEVSIVTSMALFEPLVICIFGAFILVIVLAIYMPMFSMSSGMH